MNIHFSEEEDYNSDVSEDLDFYEEDKIGSAEINHFIKICTIRKNFYFSIIIFFHKIFFICLIIEDIFLNP